MYIKSIVLSLPCKQKQIDMKTIAKRTEVVKLGDTYSVVIRANDEYSKDSFLKGDFKSLKGAEKKREQFLRNY